MILICLAQNLKVIDVSFILYPQFVSDIVTLNCVYLVPSQPVAAPLKPPRSESSIPHQQYQNYPPPLIPSQAPYPGTVPYGGMPMQPSPAQPAGWPGSQPMPQSQGAPPMYWQVGGPTGQPMNQPYPPNAPGGYPLNMGGQQPSTGASGSANPFDLF